MELAVEAEVASIAGYSRPTRRPWGILYRNEHNPENWDANSTWVGSADDPEAVIDEITAFYREGRIVPRVKVDRRTRPADFGERLAARGFHSEDTGGKTLLWDGGSPPPERLLPPGADLSVAGPPDVEALARIEAEAFDHEVGWLQRQITFQMESPIFRHYLVRLHGEPAGCASVADPPGLAREVTLIEGVATRPAYQGRGLGTALLSRIIATWLASTAAGPGGGAISPRLLCLFTSSDRAERLYHRLGFRTIGFWEETTFWLPA